MKTDEMSPRQIDVKIAELMGCKVVDPESSVPWCECHYHPHSLELSPDLKHYSGEILPAMEVVEKMRTDGFSFSAFQSSREPAVIERATVSFVCARGPCEKHGNFKHNHHGAYDIEAETLPLAICKAALTALGKIQVQA